MADSELTGKITADSSAMEAALGRIVAGVGTVKAGFAEAGTTATGAMGKASAGADGAKASVTGLAAALESLNRAAAGVSTSMEAVGVESAGAAQKVRLMNEAIMELGKASGPLLLIVVALEAIGKAFDFLKEGVSAAADVESSMATLKGAVEAQGGSWENAKTSIDQFVASESIAAGFTSGELVSALNKLVTAGNDVHDAEILTAVAAELARAKHISLEEATNVLAQAEVGRTRGLVALDHNVKAVVDSHGKMSDIIKVLNHDTSGAITNSNTYEMQQARLKVVLDQLGETFGDLILPALTNFSVLLIGAIKNGEDFGSAIGKVFKGVVGDVVGVAQAVFHLGAAINDVFHLNFAGAASEWKATQDAYASSLKSTETALVGIGEAYNEVAHGQDAWARGHQLINQDIYNHNKKTHEKLDNDSNITNEKPKSSSGPGNIEETYTQYEKYTEVIDQAKAAHDAFEASLEKLDSGLDADRAAVAGATTESQRLAAQQKLEADTKAELIAKDGVYQQMITADTTAQKQATAAHSTAISEYNRLVGAVDEYQRELANQATPATDEQKNALSILVNAMNEAKQQIGKTAEAVTQSTQRTKEDTKARDDNKKAIDSQKNASADLDVEFDKYKIKQAAENKEFNDTMGMNTAQLYSYYESLYKHDAALYEKYKAEGNDFLKAQIYPQMIQEGTKANQEMNDLYKQDYDNRQKWLEESQKNIETFLDDVIIDHKSFRDILKNIYDDILKNFIAMVAKMIVESSLFKSIFGNLMPGFGNLGGAGSSSTSTAGGLSGLFGGLFNGGASSASSTAANAQLMQTSGVNSYYGSGVSNPGSYVEGDASSVNVTQINGTTPTGSAPGALPVNITHIGSQLVTGAMIGGTIASLDGGNQTWGTALGAVGGLFGPIGSVVGGIVGSLLGPHWGPATNYPDRSDTQTYGTDLSIWQGASPSVNGQTFVAPAQYNTSMGGTSLSQQMENWANAQAGNVSALTTAQQQMYQQIEAIMGGNANASLGVANEHNGVFTLGDGQTISVTAAEALENTFMGSVGSTTDVWSLNHMAPNFNQAQVNAWGTYDSSNGTATLANPAAAASTTPTIVINVNAPTAGNLTQLAQTLQNALQKATYYNVQGMRTAV